MKFPDGRVVCVPVWEAIDWMRPEGDRRAGCALSTPLPHSIDPNRYAVLHECHLTPQPRRPVSIETVESHAKSIPFEHHHQEVWAPKEEDPFSRHGQSCQ